MPPLGHPGGGRLVPLRNRWIEIVAMTVVGCVLATPRPARSAADPAVAELLAGATAALDSTRYAVADSLANAARTRLEAVSSPDSLQVGDAHLAIARARIGTRMFADSVAYRSATKALEIYEKVTPPNDPRRADAHDALVFVFNEGGRADRALEEALLALSIR